MRESSATYGRISFAPSAQLMPTISGSACSIDVQNASIVWPQSVRPERSTIVTLIQSGNCGAASRAAAIAAFAFSVSKIVSISSRSTPPSARPRICSAYVSTTCVEGVRAKAGVVDLRAERERHVERADGAGDEAVGPAASRAMRAPSTFIS